MRKMKEKAALIAILLTVSMIAMMILPAGAWEYYKTTRANPQTDNNVELFGPRAEGAYARTLVVPVGYATIQEAINAANPGDTIYVMDGIYHEHVVVNKTVSLLGEKRETTIVDGSGVGTVVEVTADDVNVSGFAIRNSGVPIPEVWPPDCGILLYYSDRSTITNCIITSNGGHGFCFVTSRYYTISNSIVSSNKYIGIAVGDTGSSNGAIRNNTVYLNGRAGIEAYWGSDDTIVEGNTVYSNLMGIVIGWSDHCMIRDNRLHNNTASVLLDTTSHCTVLNNRISHKQGIVLLGLGNYFNNILNNTVRFGECGISLGASARYTTISGNVISGNEYGLTIGRNQGYPNYDNYIYHNDFIDNVANARNDEDRYTNVWDDGYPSGGNYWSDYTGGDEKRGPNQDQPGSDGIGDTPYKICGDAGSKDHYPVMKPWVTIIAKIDAKPDTLNLKSEGKWITVYIELPKGCNVANINVSSILLNETISAQPKPVAIGDYDMDGVPDLMVKFDRAEVINYILSAAGKRTKFSQVTLTITGKLKNGTRFEGSDIIKKR
jgi:parallel beta-helix repeat protein